MKKKLEDNKLSSIAERLKYARSISHLDRIAFSQKYSIPESTLRLWESGRGSISQKGLDKCLEALQQEGINVTMEWLKEGKGDMPTHDVALISFIKHSNCSFSTQKDFFQDIYSFLSSKLPGCIFYNINDEDMLPFYKPGEFVVGKVDNLEIELFHGKDCIVHLNSGEIYLRKVYIAKEKQINLYPCSPSSLLEPIINAKVKSIAPIFLHYII